MIECRATKLPTRKEITMKLLKKNSTGSYKVYMQQINDNFYIAMYSYGTLICAIDVNDKENRLIITDTLNYSMTTQKHLHKFITDYEFNGRKHLIANYFMKENSEIVMWFKNHKSLAKQIYDLYDQKIVRHAKNLKDFVPYQYYASTFYKGVSY